MIDEQFLQNLKHSKCITGEVEESYCLAYKMDDADGIACQLDFPPHILSRVDFFLKDSHFIQFIELSDLENDINNCNIDLAKELDEAKSRKGSRLTTTDKRRIRKKVWSTITNEVKRKWSGSIAIIERLYRKNSIINDNPEYQILIICKNSTDIRMLDSLKAQLQGMMPKVNVCNTCKANDFLLIEIEKNG